MQPPHRKVGPVAVSLFLGLLLLVSGFPAPGPGSVSWSDSGGSVPSSPTNPWSASSLGSAPLGAVRDTEPGLDLPGAVDLGPAEVPSLLIVVSFPIQHSTGLAQFLATLSEPSSPFYHRYLTSAAFDADFGGNIPAYSSAIAYFQSFGVGDLQTSADRLTLTFQASPAEIQEIFHTSVDKFDAGGQMYLAPTGSPELPTVLASAIAGVEGLSTYSTLLTRTESSGAVVQSPPAGITPPAGSTAGYLKPVTIDGVQVPVRPRFPGRLR